jgi:hypothetical protein
MTGEQCREAREHLNWTRFELATATNVPVWFIAAFEDGKATPDFLAGYEGELLAALESAGVECIASMTPERHREIAKKASQRRWGATRP